jgi:hypothetical protein
MNSPAGECRGSGSAPSDAATAGPTNHCPSTATENAFALPDVTQRI